MLTAIFRAPPRGSRAKAPRRRATARRVGVAATAKEGLGRYATLPDHLV
jgi:hypothetical protein